MEKKLITTTIGVAHYTHSKLDWKISCGQDKEEIFFDRYKVRYTENFKYVTCPKCIENKECEY